MSFKRNFIPALVNPSAFLTYEPLSYVRASHWDLGRYWLTFANWIGFLAWQRETILERRRSSRQRLGAWLISRKSERLALAAKHLLINKVGLFLDMVISVCQCGWIQIYVAHFNGYSKDSSKEFVFWTFFNTWGNFLVFLSAFQVPWSNSNCNHMFVMWWHTNMRERECTSCREIQKDRVRFLRGR